MSGTKNSTEPQKAKFSKLGIASLGLAVCAPVVSLAIWLSAIDPLTMIPTCVSLAGFALTGLILALVALFKTVARKMRLTASVLPILGILINALWVFSSAYVYWLDRQCQQASSRLDCSAHLRELAIAMRLYADENEHRYPTPDKWCDLLEKGNYVVRGQLRCPGDKKGPCSYATNPDCHPSSPKDVPLLFETKGGWNQLGGPEILSTGNHEDKGCNILFADGTTRFLKTEELSQLKCLVTENKTRAQQNSPPGNFRKAVTEQDLQYWLENMVCHHHFTNEEIGAATGLAEDEIAAALKRFDIRPDNRPNRPEGAPLLVLPYPAGRHPRIGFLEGAIDPQRETKFSVFTLWDPNSYVVVDMPEAIWSNLGLTYLAHTHIDTIWTKQGINLPKLEWNRHPDATLDIEREFANGIAFGAKVTPTRQTVHMELWLKNGTKERLTDLRIQICVLPKMAKGFEKQTNDNKIFTNPYVACRSGDGKKWIITAWENCYRPWGNQQCPCFHSDPKFPDLEPGQTHRLRGWLSFYEGADIEAEFNRIEKTGWRKQP